MSNELFKNLSNINIETALLEALNWDEEALTSLADYLKTTMASESMTSPEDVFSEVGDKFGSQVVDVLRNIFSEVIFKYNLHVGGQDIEN